MKTESFIENNKWIEELVKPFSSGDLETGMHYPTLQNFIKPSFIYKKEYKCFAIVTVGIQDNIPVGSYEYQIGCSNVGDGGHCFAPGRKWGEFNRKRDADLYYSYELLKALVKKSEYSLRHRGLVHGCVNELMQHINSLLEIQLELFA